MTVLTISRQFGSGGAEIAALVSQRLGYTYVDKQIIAEAARKSGLPVGGEIEFTEHHSELRSFIDRLLFPGPYIVAQVSVREGDDESKVTVEELDQAEALTLIRSAIHAAYQQGNAVIAGRGGQAVLRDLPGVLHVRLVAPLPYRVLRTQQQTGLGPEDARDLIVTRDRRSAAFLKEVFHIDWDDPHLYHMVLNTARWQLDAAAGMIIAGARQIEQAVAGTAG